MSECENLDAWVEKVVRESHGADEAIKKRLSPEIRRLSAAGRSDEAARLIAHLTPIGILPAMAERLERLEGKVIRDRVMAGTHVPPEGSPPEAYPEPAARFVEALGSELGAAKARRVLAWNVHGLSPEPFLEERRVLLELGSIDAWLADFHRRQVGILKARAKDGLLWFEQRITKETVEFVEARREILGGVREGGMIYATKIPYDPARYLASKDRLERRRLACHCPLAASSIAEGGAGMPSLWCNCSAGFVKFRFDIAFGQETEATVIDSALAGRELCRFAIRIPEAARHLIP